MEESVELLGIDHQKSFFLGDHSFIHEVACYAQSSGSGALAVTGLEHVKLAVLDRELHILHVAVMVLEPVGDLGELLVYIGVGLSELIDAGGGPDAGDDVFALGIHEELTEQSLFAGGGVACEGNACTGVVVEVSEYHRHYADGCSPAGGDLIHLAVEDGPLIVPGTEHGLDGSHELDVGVLRELFAELLVVELAEQLKHLFQIFCVELDILLYALLLLDLVDDGLEALLAEAHDDVGIHLNEAAIGVIDETLEFGIGVAGDETGSDFVVDTEVEDRVHHAGHGSAGTGTD